MTDVLAKARTLDLGSGLRGKRAVITGGASGIGRATALAFRRAGAEVAVIDRDRGGLDAMAGEGFAIAAADVSDASQVRTVFEEIGCHFGGIDVLIANAGISFRASVLDLNDDEWRQVIDVNLSGIFYCAQTVARMMTASNSEGTILMAASTNGITGHPNYASYNASKSGVIALARTMALELAPLIRVNAVCPGYVLTPMQRAEYTDEMFAQVDAGIPLRRHADPWEVAALYLYLASDWGRYVTGQAIVIDGGELA